MKKSVREGMTVLDIGANIGFYSQILSKLVGATGKVHAFEPSPRNFKFLVKNTAHLPNVIRHNMAVGSETVRGKLYLSENLNVDHRTFTSDEERKTIDVDMVTIDDFFHNGEKIDFVKIDVQGHDYNAILGMKETIKRSPRCTVVGEFYPFGLIKAGIDPRSYIKLMEDFGLTVDIIGFDDIFAYESKFMNQWFYCDFISVKR
jgi:FkbM family methyltransferase